LASHERWRGSDDMLFDDGSALDTELVGKWLDHLRS